jgi:zinc protease
MFNQTKTQTAGTFDRKMEAAGAETNAATWVDWTYYHANLPATELKTVMTLEADRMHNLVLKQKQVSSEKEVVANERRYRVDDDVEGTASEQLYAHAFKHHAYHWPTIGWMQDIEAFNTRDCESFYRTYYSPNNAIVALVGDLDEAKTLALIQHHYGAYAPAKLPKRPTLQEPPQKRERRVTLKRPTSSEKLLIGYRAPAVVARDHAVLTLANEVLFGGRSSRLFRALVRTQELAAEVHGSLAPSHDPGLYEIWVSMRAGCDHRRALATIDAALARMCRTRVTAAELEKAKNRMELGFLQGMETASGKAEQLGFYETVLGDAGFVFERLEQYRSVTADEIREVARRVFVPTSRTVVTVIPKADKASA